MNEDNNLVLLNKDNKKMLNLITQLNNIVSLMAKNYKIQNKKYKNNTNEEKVDLGINNEQIINQYKDEFDRLDKKIKQLNEPNYNEKLEDKKKDILRNLQYYNNEIKSLKKQQKMNEIILIKEIKNFDKRKIKVSRVDTDYNNLRKVYEKLCDQREKNEQRKKENEAKLKELKEFKIKLEGMGKEMYDIKEFKEVSGINKTILDRINQKKILEKNFGIIDGAFSIHKKKYEKEISLKEKNIFEKEKEKLKLLREMRMETIRNEKLLNKIKEMYEPIQKIQYEEEENNNNLNNNNSEIVEELIKKEKEKEQLIKETNLINEELNIKQEINKPENKIENKIENKLENKLENKIENKIENKLENKLENKDVTDEKKENELIESKSNTSRKPNLEFGKQSLNTNKTNHNDFSNLLTDHENEKENKKEEEKEPLDESIEDNEDNEENEEKKELDYKEPLEIDKEKDNIYLDKEEVDEKFNDEINLNNENEIIEDNDNKEKNEEENEGDNINEEINNDELNENFIKERDEEFIKNMEKNLNMKKNENNFDHEEEILNEEEKERKFNELLKEVKPKKGNDINPVDINQLNDIL